MAGQTELLAEVRRELEAIRKKAERLAGQVRAMETVVERYGKDEGAEPRRRLSREIERNPLARIPYVRL